jgi:hypothetical protein
MRLDIDNYFEHYISSNEFMRPTYKISPFITSDLATNHALLSVDSKPINNILLNDGESKYTANFFNSGRKCLKAILETLKLGQLDVVTILTTSGSLYVSGCVTQTIDRYCRWNREITKETSVILVIHEFGKHFTEVKGLLKHNLPIIEDYAHSFPAVFKQDEFFGDFLLFSLSKFLPLQSGGLLFSNKKYVINEEKAYLSEVAKSTFFYYSDKFEQFFEKRKSIEKAYINELSKLGFSAFFQYEKFECPGAFVFQCDLTLDVLQAMKDFLQAHSIECSVFYGNKAFFLPSHHRMTQFDVGYIVYLIRSFLEKNFENK